MRVNWQNRDIKWKRAHFFERQGYPYYSSAEGFRVGVYGTTRCSMCKGQITRKQEFYSAVHPRWWKEVCLDCARLLGVEW